MPEKTYSIAGEGPYDEREAREKIRAYCDDHGFHAALTVTVIELTQDGNTGRTVDPGQFLDDR